MSSFIDRTERRAKSRRDAAVRRAAAAVYASPFEAMENRVLFSVLAHYYNDPFWGTGGPPAAPVAQATFPAEQVYVGRAGDVNETVQNIDFDWGGGSPNPAIQADNFSTLFVGKLLAPQTGSYEILGYGDDDTHVFVNGQLVSSDPGGHGSEDPRGEASVGRGGGATPITLQANTQYDLVVLQHEGGGGAAVHLNWVLPGGDTTAPTAVPAANLLATNTAPTAPAGLARDAAVTNGVKINFTDPNTNELRYDLQRRTGTTGAFTTVAVGAINDTSITDYSALPNTAYQYQVVAYNLAGTAVSATPLSVTTGAAPAATTGAQGYYFNDQWWKGGAPLNTLGSGVIVGRNPDFSENAGAVGDDENWGDGANGTPGSPEPGVIRQDNFSTVFTGKITAPETGAYTILGFSDDDSYVWVNGQLVSADPGGHGVPGVVTDIDVRNPITLQAGQQYDFVAIQSEGGGGAAMILRWVTPTMDPASDPIDIPAEAYTSNTPSTAAAPTGLTATAVTGDSIYLHWTDAATSELRYSLVRSTSADFSNPTEILLPINTSSYTDRGLTAGTQYFYRLQAENFQGVSAAATANATPSAAANVGLRATIYDSQTPFGARNFINDPSNTNDPIVRNDPNVDVVFDDTTYDSPDPRIGADTFSVVWEGNLQIDTAGAYTFYGRSDDGIRVFVDGNLVVDAFVDRGPTETASAQPITLTAGQHELRVQYYENGGGAMAQVSYEGPGVAKQVIPLTKLTPIGASAPLRAPLQVTAGSIVGQSATVTWVDNTAAETGYRVERSTDGTNFTAVATVPANQSAYVDLLPNNTDSFTYRVVALGAGGATQTSEVSGSVTAAAQNGGAVTFANFADTSAFSINGPAAAVDVNNDGTTDRLRLTAGGPDDAFDGQISSAFLNDPRSIQGFTTSFDFVVGENGAQSANPADGFTFTLQAADANGFAVGPTAIGGGGGGLGYTGIGNSVAVKFDIYNNINQTGLYINGEGISDDPNFARNRTIPDTFNINGGTPLRATISYDPVSKTLTETIDDINNPATPAFTTSYAIDLANAIGSSSAYVGFTGATGGESAQQDILNFAYSNVVTPVNTAPHVTSVFLAGSTWAASFKTFMAAQGQGSAQYGFAVPATDQLNELPWTNLNQVSITFDQDVTVAQDDLSVRGVNVPTYAVQSFAYDPATKTATWTLAQSIINDKIMIDLDGDAGGVTFNGAALDGEWTNAADTFPSGNGTAGGDFRFQVNVLPGDVNRDSRVNAVDLSNVRARQLTSTSNPGTAPNTYNIFSDVNGTGNINAVDLSGVRSNQLKTLPATDPTGALTGSSITKDVFGSSAIL